MSSGSTKEFGDAIVENSFPTVKFSTHVSKTPGQQSQ